MLGGTNGEENYRALLNFNTRKVLTSVAKFLVPDWGDIVDYGIGLSYRPASL